MTKLPNIHPGVVLLDEFIHPMGLTVKQLSVATGVNLPRLTGIIKGQKSINTETALRLAKYFGTSVKFWLGLQNDFDIEEQAALLEEQLAKISTVQPV